MFGNATIDIPRIGDIGPSHTDGLSDKLAMVIGRIAAMTLSEHDGTVIVTLGNGRVIGLEYEFDMEVIRRCGGFREYANNVVMGPIL